MPFNFTVVTPGWLRMGFSDCLLQVDMSTLGLLCCDLAGLDRLGLLTAFGIVSAVTMTMRTSAQTLCRVADSVPRMVGGGLLG